MDDPTLHDPERWCALPPAERRERLARELAERLPEGVGVEEVRVRPGSVERPWDLTAEVITDVGTLGAPLWSHARAVVFCDPSIHVANRRQVAPGRALEDAAVRLRTRLAVPFRLESRGLTLTLPLSDRVERSWTAEKSLFRGGARVVREDTVREPGDADLRELLAALYTGPALRLEGEEGEAFLLPAGHDSADAEWISLCMRCRSWEEGALEACPRCDTPLDVRLVSRPPLR